MRCESFARTSFRGATLLIIKAIFQIWIMLDCICAANKAVLVFAQVVDDVSEYQMYVIEYH